MPDFYESFTEALEFAAAFTPEAFTKLLRHLDRDLIDEALQCTGTPTLRRRCLPADRTVWLRLGMALMRDVPIIEVARRLESLLDETQYLAAERRTLYHEQRKIELGFGEIKTDLLDRFETIRSKSPTAVAQEMRGILIAYNLVRLEMVARTPISLDPEQNRGVSAGVDIRGGP